MGSWPNLNITPCSVARNTEGSLPLICTATRITNKQARDHKEVQERGGGISEKAFLRLTHNSGAIKEINISDRKIRLFCMGMYVK